MITTARVLFFASPGESHRREADAFSSWERPSATSRTSRPRARRALSEADAIFCEDTRVTAKLAARFAIPAPRISCPAPREDVARRRAARAAFARRDGGARVRRRDAGALRPRRAPGRGGGRGRAIRRTSCRARPRPPRRWRFRACRPFPTSSWASCRPARASAGALPGGPPEPHGDPRVVRGAAPAPRVPGGRRAWSWAPAAPAWRGSSRSSTRRLVRGTLPELAETFARPRARAAARSPSSSRDAAASPPRPSVRRKTSTSSIREALAAGEALKRCRARSRGAPAGPRGRSTRAPLELSRSAKPSPTVSDPVVRVSRLTKVFRTYPARRRVSRRP